MSVRDVASCWTKRDMDIISALNVEPLGFLLNLNSNAKNLRLIVHQNLPFYKLWRYILNFIIISPLLMTSERISENFSDKGLMIGSIAPNIKTTDIFGNQINLQKEREKYRFILIEFFRGAFWKPWKAQLINLRENIDKFKKREVKIIPIAIDSRRHLTQLCEENNFEFPMISDRGAKIAKEYNVYMFGSMGKISSFKRKFAVPSSFLINKDGVIVWRFISEHKNRPSIDMLIGAVDENS